MDTNTTGLELPLENLNLMDEFSRLPDLVLVKIAKAMTRDMLDCLQFVNRKLYKLTQLPEIKRIKRPAELFIFQTTKAQIFCLQTTALVYKNGLTTGSMPRNLFYFIHRETDKVEKKETDNNHWVKSLWKQKTFKLRNSSIPDQMLTALYSLLQSHVLNGITIQGITIDLKLMQFIERIDTNILEFISLQNCPLDHHSTNEICHILLQIIQSAKLNRFDVFATVHPASFGESVVASQHNLKILHLRTACFYPSKVFIPTLGQFETIYMEGLVIEGDWALEAVRIRMEINVRGRWLISISNLFTDEAFEEIIAKHFDVHEGKADRCFTNLRNKLKAECNIVSGSIADLFYVHFFVPQKFDMKQMSKSIK